MHRVLLPFEFSEPTSVAEAAKLVDGDRVRVLAGGVDLVLKMRLRKIVPERVVSLQKVPGLDYVRVDGPAAATAAADGGQAGGLCVSALLPRCGRLRLRPRCGRAGHCWLRRSVRSCRCRQRSWERR